MPSAAATPVKRIPSSLALWANLAVVYVIWGSTYFGIAIAIKTMPPFLMASARFALAGLLLLAWDLARHPEARRLPTRRQVLDSAIVGGLLLGIGNGFVVFGEKTVPSGIAAILIGMMPLWFAVLGWLYLRQKLPRLVVFAVALGFVGVALLIWPTGDGANHFDPFGIFILFLAPLGWAHGSIYSQQRAKLPKSPLTASGFQMLAGAAVTGIESVIAGEPAHFDPSAISAESVIAVVYLILFGSMLAYTAYAWLLRNAPLSLVGTYAYVNPVVAVALGTIFLHEPISARTIIAAAVIILAVAIIVTARGRLAGAHASDEAGAPASDEPSRLDAEPARG
ncbi:MAG TPA: EamA family transporter [Candidatus Dormibacteraeota bacterium]|nr:EamA family transporter [Candidatus Dormibacteraeota bacterium]